MFFVLKILGERTLSLQFPKREMEITVSFQFPIENCPFPLHSKTIGKFRYFLLCDDKKLGKVNAKLCFSPKFCSTVAAKAMQLLFFTHHEVISIFLGSKNYRGSDLQSAGSL